VNSEAKLVVDKELQDYHASPDEVFQRQFQAVSPRSRLYYSRIEAIGRKYEFPRSDVIETFINNVGIAAADSNNPILSRTLLFKLGMDEDELIANAAIVGNNIVPAENQLAQYFGQQEELMSRVGDHVWGLKLDYSIWPHQNQNRARAGQLVTLLGQVENLKTLKIFQGNLFSYEPNVQWDQLLPRLAHLTSLDLTGMHREALGLALVRKYGSQLTHFSCMGSFFGYTTILELNELLPNLRSFSVKNIDFRGLDRLSRVNWGLEELHFTGLARDVAAAYFITAVAKFAETLVELRLLSNATGRFVGDLQFFFSTKMINGFPNLKKLVVSFLYTDKSWFNELLYSKCLQLTELHVRLTNKDSDVVNYSVFLGAFEKLSKLERIIFWMQDSNNRDESIVSSIINRPPKSVEQNA